MQKQRLTTKKLANHLSMEIDIPEARARELVDTVFVLIKETLRNGDAVFIQNFGVFDLGRTKARQLYDPNTNGFRPTKSRNKLNFKPSDNLTKDLN